jgi:hypothetical protein
VKIVDTIYSGMLQAFLEKVLKGVGQVSRRYPLEFGRVDLAILFNSQEYLVAVKLVDTNLDLNLEDIAGYFAPSDVGWLVIFDRAKDKPFAERIYWKTEVFRGKTIHVVGC